jgi:beta-carotene hydroxylase
MKLRFAADRRTLLWAFVFLPCVAFAPYVAPRSGGWLVPLSLYAGFCAGVFAHNQNHCPTFRGRTANAFYSVWLSVFYGYPTFAWIPTHNLNHHRFLNRDGDATITWRYSKKNTWLVASTYFFVSAYWQKAVTDAFTRKARATRPRLYRQIVAQKVTVALAHAAFFSLAVGLHGWRAGVAVYASGFGAAAAMGLWGMIFINYIQHIHCDPWSAHNHSRNFVSPLGNWLVFNNGLHAAHHEHPGAHWSELPALFARIADGVHPALRQPSILRFCLRTYLLGAFSARFRTRQIGRAAYDPPADGALLSLAP